MLNSEKFSPTQYQLQSIASGQIFDDNGWLLDAPGETQPTLIRTVYEQKQLKLKPDHFGFYKFASWLPIRRMLQGSSAPITYQSSGLAKELGLSRLFITFSGWWPEKGAFMKTCSFKETEAYSVCARLDNQNHRVLVVASAGNTARSFARVCSDNHIPLLLCMPEDNIGSLWFDEPINDNVKLILTRSGSDYFDAIHLSNLACKSPRFLAEGGARNVARRDGMGTTVLSAVTAIGEIPEYYFQAIGSGTGAIAAWEANLRLITDGRFGNSKMKLMVSQNEPFVPIMEAWNAGSRHMLPMNDSEARQKAAQIDAKVLSNRKPPYPQTGGLFDALVDTGGDVLSASNVESRTSADFFMQTEGIDIHPAAAVATATLIKEVKAKRIAMDALIMLNITGGGERKFRQNKHLHFLKPSLIFDSEPDEEQVVEKAGKLFY
ncbi:MAG: cysteate synthase [Bacteroidales bacterium]|nr:cysteate synthase [Bacteroidales bacterium]MDZ4203212.1 cysteate synthase [Bacteroidales bacterium]